MSNKPRQEEKQISENLDSTILGESLRMCFNTTVVVFLSQTIKFCLKSLFVSNAMFLISSYHSNLKLKNIEKSSQALEEVSSFSKKLLAIRKKVAPLMLTVNIAITTMSGFYILRKELISTQVTRKNPFANQQLDIDGRQTESDLLLEGIEDNILLTEEEKEQIQKLQKYFEENPYLDYESTYYNFATSDIFYPISFSKQKEHILAEYFRDINMIQVYDKETREVSLPHEAVHQTGYLETRFLNEGITSLIVSEYCHNGAIVDGYGVEIYLTEIILEFVGKDTLLEAFSEENEDLIHKKLSEKLTVDEIQDLLTSLEEYSISKSDYQKLEISHDEHMMQFIKTGTTLIEVIDKFDLSEEQKQYIYYCYVYSSSVVSPITMIPKFNMNESKIHDYPKIEVDFKVILECLLADTNVNESARTR